jgi:hypothetical protein
VDVGSHQHFNFTKAGLMKVKRREMRVESSLNARRYCTLWYDVATQSSTEPSGLEENVIKE